MFDVATGIYTEKMTAALQTQQIPYDMFDYSADSFLSLLTSGVYSCCFLIGFGSAGGGCWKTFNTPAIRRTLTSWVSAGGLLLTQGEGCVMKIYNEWMSLPWYQVSYSREMNDLNTSCPLLSPRIRPALQAQFSMKAVRFQGVANEHCIYCYDYEEDREGNQLPTPPRAVHSNCSVAMARYGLGRVIHVGDVNAENSTIQAMIALTVLFDKHEDNWLRRRAFLLFLIGCRLIVDDEGDQGMAPTSSVPASSHTSEDGFTATTPTAGSNAKKVFALKLLCIHIASFI